MVFLAIWPGVPKTVSAGNPRSDMGKNKHINATRSDKLYQVPNK